MQRSIGYLEQLRQSSANDPHFLLQLSKASLHACRRPRGLAVCGESREFGSCPQELPGSFACGDRCEFAAARSCTRQGSVKECWERHTPPFGVGQWQFLSL